MSLQPLALVLAPMTLNITSIFHLMGLESQTNFNLRRKVKIGDVAASHNGSEISKRSNWACKMWGVNWPTYEKLLAPENIWHCVIKVWTDNLSSKWAPVLFSTAFILWVGGSVHTRIMKNKRGTNITAINHFICTMPVLCANFLLKMTRVVGFSLLF